MTDDTMLRVMGESALNIPPLPESKRLLIMESHIFDMRMDAILRTLDNGNWKQAVAQMVYTRDDLLEGKASHWMDVTKAENFIEVMNCAILACLEGDLDLAKSLLEHI